MANSMNAMQAAAIDRFGGPDQIALHTLPVPQIGPDEVLIRVHTASVGAWDPWVRQGEFAAMSGQKPHFPYVLGADGSGTVAAVGERVKRFHPGDAVYGYRNGLSAKDGFYAQYTAIKANDVAPVPKGLDLEAAGAMPADAVTALCGLELLALSHGDSITIFGASGGIGHIALQLAKRMGARVFAVASGEDGVELANALGADAVVDGHRGDVRKAARQFAPDGIDAGLFTAGGDGVHEALETLRDGARVAYPHGVRPEPRGRSNLNVQGYDGRATPGLYERLNRLIEGGPFRIHVASVFPLSGAAEAHRALDQHYVGKLALKVGAR